jgi:subtilisin family serine protease
MRYGRWSLLAVAACAAALTLPSVVHSQRKPFKVKVIVVLTAVDESLAASAVTDERALASPTQWRYLQPSVVAATQRFERAHGFRATHVFSHALLGFAAELTAEQISALEADPGVAYIEAEQTYTVNAQTLPWGINRVDADISSTLAGNGSGAVSGVNVYVVDTGVGTHRDINLVAHMNFTGDGRNTDCHGHGTHVAGTIAARDDTNDVVGVAPGAPVTGLKVLGCSGSGTTANIIKALDWITANGSKPGVVNMSLGGGVSTAMDSAVQRSAAAGFVYALAAGNSGANACNTSPARAGAGTNNGIITTAATSSTNREASWSNCGSCVDIWAPGVSILSTRLGGGTTTMSGTSMASPHVAGVAALFRSGNAGATPSAVEADLKAEALTFGTTSKDGRTIQIANARNY